MENDVSILTVYNMSAEDSGYYVCTVKQTSTGEIVGVEQQIIALTSEGKSLINHTVTLTASSYTSE